MALRIVSHQSEEEIRRQESHKQLTQELQRFAANFLRLVSGSGKALDLLGQMERVSDAIREYAEAHGGKLPSQKVIHGILDDRAAFLEYPPTSNSWLRFGLVHAQGPAPQGFLQADALVFGGGDAGEHQMRNHAIGDHDGGTYHCSASAPGGTSQTESAGY